MAGSLVKINEEIVTSAVASVTLTGIDSTYDVYMVKFENVKPSADNVNLEMRFTVSGTPDSSANYDLAWKKLDATTTFANQSATNLTASYVNIQVGGDTNEQNNGIMYIFNANNSSEYTFCTIETVFSNPFSGGLNGSQGGNVLTVAQAVDGVQFFFSTSVNHSSGTYTLYGLKK